MAPIKAIVDSICAAIGPDCTSATVTTLSNYLLPKTNTENASIPINTKRARTHTNSKTNPTPANAKPRSKKVVEITDENGVEAALSQKERSILATEVINATLKALTEAIKTPPLPPVRRQAPSKDLMKASGRKTLRRSTSLPHEPLQERSLNRIASSPGLISKHNRSSSNVSIISTGHRSTAECARLAFACMRSLQAAQVPVVDLPPLQLENGMSVLVGKLVALGLDDLAVKEIRILRRKLDQGDSAKKLLSAKANVNQAPQELHELLDFGTIELTGSKLGLAISTQLHILRIMASSRKHNVQAALQLLNPSHHSSPTNLIISTAKDSKSKEKAARQLQTLSDVLLSLCPSVSSSDDAIALEPKLSIAPDVGFRLQTCALQNRLAWWKLADHKADLAKELLDPFNRCLSTFARRSERGAPDTAKLASESFESLRKEWTRNIDSDEDGLSTVLFETYRLLSSLAQESGDVSQALVWTQKLQQHNGKGSETKKAFVATRLVSLVLRKPTRDTKDEELLLHLLEQLEAPYTGTSSDIDDLLTEVSAARRAALAVLSRATPTCTTEHRISEGMRQMCEALIFLCPRLCLRYLGKPLDSKSATKDLVRYEQSRLFIAKFGLHAIDSTLFLAKSLLSEDRLTWDLLDSKLQDCLCLLDRLDPKSGIEVKSPASSPSYYVRISHLYYTHFLNQRRNVEGAKDSQQLRVLRRSVDCIKTRSSAEKKSALSSTKLERMAELYKSAGRYDELFQVFQRLQDDQINDGTLNTIASALAYQSLRSAWDKNESTALLARTVHTLLKIQIKYLDSSNRDLAVDDQWPADEQGAILEHQLTYLSQAKQTAASSNLLSNVFTRLLSVYDRKIYPVRRVRVLIELMNAGTEYQGLLNGVENELSLSEFESYNIGQTADSKLHNYWMHFQTLALSTLELQQDQPRVDDLKRYVATWSSINEKSSSLDELKSEIEDIHGLIDHLQDIAAFSQVKGLDDFRIIILRLIVDLNETLGSVSSKADDAVLSFVDLGSQWLRLGYSGRAGLAFDKAQTHRDRSDISSLAILRLHIAYSEYLLANGNIEKGEEHLSHAQAVYSQDQASHPETAASLTFQEKSNKTLLISDAFLIHSKLALSRGAAHSALNHAKQSVRLLRRAWARIEERQRLLRKTSSIDTSSVAIEVDQITEGVSKLNVSVVSISADTAIPSPPSGACFWAFIAPLIRSLQHLSEVYAYHGMFQETIYYAEQGYKLAKEVSSDAHQAMAAASMGNALLKAGSLEKGSELLMEAKKLSSLLQNTREAANLAYYTGSMHGVLGDHAAELASYEVAETILESLLSAKQETLVVKSQSGGIEEAISKLAISKPKTTVRKNAAPRAKVPIKGKKTATRAKSPVPEGPSSISEECTQLVAFRATVLRSKALVLSLTKQCGQAHILLDRAGESVKTQIEAADHRLAMAKQLLAESLEHMTADPVYSVLQDSTISFPSVSTRTETASERLCITKTTPPKKAVAAKSGRGQARVKAPSSDGCFEKLQQAQEYLLEAHYIAIGAAPVALIHTITSLLNSVSILLSASGHSKGKLTANPSFASCTIETARSLALRRERKAILSNPPKTSDSSWPQPHPADSRRVSLGGPTDMSRFQRDYVDIIPKSWTAISISLSDSHNELAITRLQAGNSPFVLRLPLGRHNSMDADEEVFGFEQGRSELQEIIELANKSAHSARDMTGKDAKIEWWEEREALDARMKELLENIEKVWLGGFRGIFSQHARRSEFLARFQKAFQNILDKHLPSRQKSRKRNAIAMPRVALDSRVLDLFIGLGDASEEECDLSEPLTDLLYFVVDILQFHGELNAYAEIDFDSIMIETHDALRGYHAAVHSSNLADEGVHTILILDKALHAFPWESLPCMNGQAVSRLPSLGCLRDRIMLQRNEKPENSPDRLYIDPTSGSYILNPGGDLKNTQATFQKSLQALSNWNGVIKREPKEEEIKENLSSKDLFLYFGHGSGAQYIRAREVRNLEKCSVAFLMGCSSGTLVEAGEFEPYGPAINYMHAGSPALVATLWDVTDKDIDKFAKTTFEHWGLFEAKSKIDRKGKGKSRAQSPPSEQLSLVEAVAKGREACNLRYLNAAAVCVYGVPVYLK